MYEGNIVGFRLRVMNKFYDMDIETARYIGLNRFACYFINSELRLFGCDTLAQRIEVLKEKNGKLISSREVEGSIVDMSGKMSEIYSLLLQEVK